MPEQFEIRIRKEALKFAAAHMTVFPDGTKEAMHGHQYMPTLTVTLRDASFEKMLPFSDFKAAMKKIALHWDEKVLLASENPYFKRLSQDQGSFEFTLCNKRYVLPFDEIVLLKTDNITCERLAEVYFQHLQSELKTLFADPNILSISVYIEESAGQGAA
jgi:6-pyruvoyltetrahydropterin/6-carboxytetrahydropterin synthase